VSVSFLAAIAVVLLNITLGLFTLAGNPRRLANVSFASACFLLAIWTGANYLADHDVANSLLWTRVTFLSVTLALLALVLFASSFPRRFIRSTLFIGAASAVSLVMLVLESTPAFIPSVSFDGKTSNVVTGPLYPLFVVYLAVYVLGMLGLIWYARQKAQGADRQRLRYLTLGIGLMIALAMITNLLLPLILGTNDLARYGTYATVVFIALTSYAIVRHRLMDIRLVMARSVAYSLLVLILGSGYSAGLFMLQAAFFRQEVGMIQIGSSAILALIMALTFQPLRQLLERVTDGIFFRDRYDQTEFLARLSRVVSSTIILETLTKRVLTEVLESMRLAGGAIVVMDREEKLLIQNQKLLTKRLALADVESFFHRHSLTIFDDLPEGRKKALLRGLGVSVVVPLESREGVIGLILLGAKKSGDPFSESDLEVFEILSPELAVGIENARAYHQIERFNETLRLKVERATRKLREANSHLRELDKAKDEFISLASHQLRTPLTAIKGYLSMVADGDAGKLGAKQREFIEIAAGGAERMASLIDDLLNVSRMDAGRFLIERVPTDLSEMVEQEMRELATHASARHLLLTYHAPRTRVPILMLDSTKTRQVIINFIDNAIYYTKEGGVEVSLEKVGETVEFRVKDTGIGISPEDQQKLFTKFYRASNARDVRPDGTGLGLYLAKEVVESQGGEIICESKLGEGSTFGFRFKIPKRPRRSLTKPVVAAYHRRRAKHLV
jgi:signal transduction histidine kinase